MSSPKKFLVAGVGPLPPQSPGKLFAPGLRVWGMAEQLALAGHQVHLATIEFTGQPATELHRFAVTKATDQAAAISPLEAIPVHNDNLAEAFEQTAQELAPDAWVGCTDLINRELARIPTEAPMWFDYFGDPMAERQMIARLYDSDHSLADQWKTLVPALVRGDRFSGCSRYQAGAILGELGSVGRLNRHTVSTDLAQVLHPWIAPILPDDAPAPVMRQVEGKPKSTSGAELPADAFVAIQTGGFNTWLDIETLFASLEIVMANRPQFHFACTGGAIPGHNEHSFGRFREWATASRLQDRFHFLGWLPLGRVPRAIAEANLGLNVDRPSPEGWLGTRNRLMDWLLAELPVVSTRGTELVEELEQRNFIRAVPQCDADLIAEAIESIIDNYDTEKVQARHAAEYLQTQHSPEVCLAPLLRWAENPESSPDLIHWRDAPNDAPILWTQAASDADQAALIEELETEKEEADDRA